MANKTLNMTTKAMTSNTQTPPEPAAASEDWSSTEAPKSMPRGDGTLQLSGKGGVYIANEDGTTVQHKG